MQRKLFCTSLSSLRHPQYENSRAAWYKWEQRNLYIDEIKGEIFKALIVSDEIVIDLPGPASEAVRLLEWLGKENLIKLVKDGTISFSLGTKQIIAVNDYIKPNEKVNLEIHGKGAVEYNDPQAAFSHALKTETDLNKSEINSLSEILADNTTIIPDNLYLKIIDETNNDISGKLGSERFLEYASRSNLGVKYIIVSKANEIFLMGAELGCNDFTESHLDWNILRNKMSERARTSDTHGVLDNIIRFEGFPDFEHAIISGKYNMSDVIKIRNDKHIEDFRKFLNSIPVDNKTSEILSIYRESYEKKVFDGLPKKLIRFGVVSALSTGVGALIAGPTGAIGGIVIGAVDTFFLDKSLNGWNPRVFIKKNF